MRRASGIAQLKGLTQLLPRPPVAVGSRPAEDRFARLLHKHTEMFQPFVAVGGIGRVVCRCRHDKLAIIMTISRLSRVAACSRLDLIIAIQRTLDGVSYLMDTTVRSVTF